MTAFTNVAESRKAVVVGAAIVLAVLVLVRTPFSADQFQPIRAILGAVALAVIALLGAPNVSRRALVPYALLAVAAALTVVSALFNGLPSGLYGVEGRYMGLVAGALFAVAALVGSLVMNAHVRVLGVAVTVAGAIAGLWMLGERVSSHAPAAGPSGNAVLSGGFVAIAASVALAMAVTTPAKSRMLYYAGAAMAIAGVASSGSRGAVLALLLGGVLPLWMLVKSSSTRGILIVLALVAVTLGVAVAGNPGKFSAGAFGQGSAGSRLEIWKGTARLIVDHPLLGVGPGRFLYVYPRYDTLERVSIEPGDVRADQAHNEILQLSAETGLPAAVCVGVFFVIAVSRGWRASLRRDGVALIATAGLLGGAGYSIFGISTVELDVLTWMLAGIALTRTLDGGAADTRSERALAWAAAAASIAVAVLSSVYLIADTAYAEGLRAMEARDWVVAASRYERAARLVPVADVYRVAMGDSALYGGTPQPAAALEIVDHGLRLEPESYDLQMQKARLLSAVGGSAPDVADAAVRAVELYPLGVDAQGSAIRALKAAGDEQQAQAIEEKLTSQLRGVR